MELPVVDARLAAQQALQDDPVQRKLQIDALRDRLAEPNKDAAAQRKLKEACQGFEAIFLQRVWEQMRKNVAKEGYLHSRDEEAYQGMFDQELVKKMADAGGIGLAEKAYPMRKVLLTQALQLIERCDCEAGCPSCVGPVGEVGSDGKQLAVHLLKDLLKALQE